MTPNLRPLLASAAPVARPTIPTPVPLEYSSSQPKSKPWFCMRSSSFFWQPESQRLAQTARFPYGMPDCPFNAQRFASHEQRVLISARLPFENFSPLYVSADILRDPALASSTQTGLQIAALEEPDATHDVLMVDKAHTHSTPQLRLPLCEYMAPVWTQMAVQMLGFPPSTIVRRHQWTISSGGTSKIKTTPGFAKMQERIRSGLGPTPFITPPFVPAPVTRTIKVDITTPAQRLSLFSKPLNGKMAMANAGTSVMCSKSTPGRSAKD
jgi:hypothetical protein